MVGVTAEIPRSPSEMSKFEPTSEQLSKEALLTALSRVVLDQSRSEEDGSTALAQLQVVQLASQLQIPNYNGKGNGGPLISGTLMEDFTGRSFSFQEVKQKLLPDVEAYLSQQAAWLAQIMESSDVDSLTEEVGIQMDTLQASHQQYTTANISLAEQIVSYLQQLLSFAQDQHKFVEHANLNKEPKAQKAANDALKASAHLNTLQAEVTEARVLAHMYTAESVGALKKVSRHLMEAEKEVDTKVSQLEARVRQYEELGPEFLTLAEDFRKLQAEVEENTRFLNQLREENGDWTNS